MSEHTPFDLPDRFWAKTRPTEDGCLIWTACLNSRGYGCFSLAGTIFLAHRLAHLAHVGPIPDGWHVDHLCRVRACVAPSHLEAVTPAENNRRMVDALTTVHPVTGDRCYPTVTHNYVQPGFGRVSASHVDMLYMRQRCPVCPDVAAA